MQERLPEPIIYNSLELDILQPAFGKTLKKNGKIVETYLNTFKKGDEWNEEKLRELDDEIKAKG